MRGRKPKEARQLRSYKISLARSTLPNSRRNYSRGRRGDYSRRRRCCNDIMMRKEWEKRARPWTVSTHPDRRLWLLSFSYSVLEGERKILSLPEVYSRVVGSSSGSDSQREISISLRLWRALNFSCLLKGSKGVGIICEQFISFFFSSLFTSTLIFNLFGLKI